MRFSPTTARNAGRYQFILLLGAVCSTGMVIGDTLRQGFDHGHWPTLAAAMACAWLALLLGEPDNRVD